MTSENPGAEGRHCRVQSFEKRKPDLSIQPAKSNDVGFRNPDWSQRSAGNYVDIGFEHPFRGLDLRYYASVFSAFKFVEAGPVIWQLGGLEDVDLHFRTGFVQR